jgi:phage terminase large subunit-like protein
MHLPPKAFARLDWRERIMDGRSLMPDLPWLDQERAQRAIRFYNALHIPDVPGQPLIRDSGGEWFREIVGALHGSLDVDGDRKIKNVFLLVPKKNGKTTNAAALMLVSLMLNQRPRATFLLVGATQKISTQAFEQIEGMILADPVLRDRLKVTPHLKTITHLQTQAKLQVVSFDPKIVTGTKPAGFLVDELHLLGDIANADRVIGQLRGGLLSQPEGFGIFITTQSERKPAGVFKNELERARKIRDGEADGPSLSILYEFPEEIANVPAEETDAKWRNPALWHVVSPSLNRSVPLKDLEEKYREAAENGLAELIRWSSQHLNIEVGRGIHDRGWAGAALWPRGVDAAVTLEAILTRCEVCTIGIDGGGLDDLLGLYVLGREKVTALWLGWGKAFISPEGWDRRKANWTHYEEFLKRGELVKVAKLRDDVDAVVDIVRRVKDAGLLAKVGVDPAGLGIIVDALAAIGVTEDSELLGGVRQGIALMGAIKTIERKLADGTFVHADQEIMAWCAGNAVVEPTPTGMRIARDASGFGKVDPLMAGFNASALMGMNPEPPGSIYSADRGLRFF